MSHGEGESGEKIEDNVAAAQGIGGTRRKRVGWKQDTHLVSKDTFSTTDVRGDKSGHNHSLVCPKPRVGLQGCPL